jgi:hypothetical protein
MAASGAHGPWHKRDNFVRRPDDSIRWRKPLKANGKVPPSPARPGNAALSLGFQPRE